MVPALGVEFDYSKIKYIIYKISRSMYRKFQY